MPVFRRKVEELGLQKRADHHHGQHTNDDPTGRLIREDLAQARRLDALLLLLLLGLLREAL